MLTDRTLEQVRRVAGGIGGIAGEPAGAVEQVDDVIRRQSAAEMDRGHGAGEARSHDGDRPAVAGVMEPDPALG